MINRVLIRIKVVQLLYSYLLADASFTLEAQPSNPTKEKRFTHALYMDLLVLMVRVAEGISKRGGEHPLKETHFIQRLLEDNRIRSLMARYKSEGFPLEKAVVPLTEAVRESGLYKNFAKSDERSEGIWRDIYNIIFKRDAGLNELIAERPNYSIHGAEKAEEMVGETFTNFFAAQDSLPAALRTLDKSLDQARELYFRLLLLPVELTDLRARQIEEAREKYIVTDEDLNPNLRFVENDLVERLRRNERIRKYAEDHHISWRSEDEHLLRELLKEVMASEIYRDYMAAPATDLHEDVEFWRNIFKHVLLHSPQLLEALEDRSVFWNDDIDTIGTFVLKTLKRFDAEDPGDPIMDKYKDEEDARFGADLFSDTVRNREKYRTMINDNVDSRLWESERLAYMDVIVIMTALAEILNFPKIPLNVSINEYVEIAKAYSSPRSGGFVHGLLATITRRLQEEGKLLKQ